MVSISFVAKVLRSGAPFANVTPRMVPEDAQLASSCNRSPNVRCWYPGPEARAEATGASSAATLAPGTTKAHGSASQVHVTAAQAPAATAQELQQPKLMLYQRQLLLQRRCVLTKVRRRQFNRCLLHPFTKQRVSVDQDGVSFAVLVQ